MEFTFFLWALATFPLITLFFSLLVLKWKAYRAGALSLLLAAAIGFRFFKADIYLLALAGSKGLSFGIFFLSFIWAAVFFYNIVLSRTGVDRVIGQSISALVQDRLVLSLLLGWCLSGFFEGIVGFGVPVIVTAPFLVAVGFTPFTAVAIALVGHCWAVSYGPLGLAYYTLQLITRLPPASLKFWLSLMMSLPIVLSGAAVAHICGGGRAVKKALPMIIPTGAVMSAVYTLLPQIGAETLNSLLSGLCGALLLVGIQKVLFPNQSGITEPPVHGRGNDPTLGKAVSPFCFLVAAVFLLQVPVIREVLSPLTWSLSYPAASTGLGYLVPAEPEYAPIGIVSHPAPLILLTTALGGMLFSRAGLLPPDTLQKALPATFRQVLPASLTLLALVIMALVMNDTGMTTVLAQGVAILTGQLYPVMVPLVGVLGCFLTGTNNNSNVLFGVFQKQAALNLGVSSLILVSAHSVGGGLGSSITPAKVLLGTSALGLGGQEDRLLRLTVRYCLFIAFVTGLLTWVFSYAVFTHVP